mmetsp:Transcript_24326/g.58248  ORF Transcript_24326/g.58248 Transcript_24326/m.58248 type:complete len:261 (-) Transcript_24326:177-959(-)
MRVLGGHARPTEAGVQQEHGHAVRPELFGEEDRGDVARGARHVVAVVMPLVFVLRPPPLDRPRLARDDDDLARGLLDEAVLEQRRGDAHRADGAHIDLLELLRRRQVAQGFLLLPEVARVVHHDVEGATALSRECLRHPCHLLVALHVDALHHRHALESLELLADLTDDDDDVGALRAQLPSEGEAEPLVATRDEHTLAPERRAIVHSRYVEEPGVALGLCALEALGLVGERVRTRTRGAGRGGQPGAHHAPDDQATGRA